MNILVDALPTAVMLGGQETPINADFRSCLKTVLAFEDGDLTQIEKQAILLRNLYPVPPIGNIAEARRVAIKFLNGGQEEDDNSDDVSRVYSWEKDANLIFAAFQQTHGIDLETANLHWWKFIALFMDLGSDTVFCQLVNLRRKIKSGKASREEKEAARSLGDVFEVPELDTRTLEEREAEAEFMRLVKGG